MNSPLDFSYTNYRGEKSVRHVHVINLRWGATEWHPEPQWLLKAYDLDKGAVREFAVKDMQPVGKALNEMAPGEYKDYLDG